MKNHILILIFVLPFSNFAQDNDCLPLLKDGLYKHVLNSETSSFKGDLKTYFESQTFKEDFKSGKWNLGVNGVIPVGETGLMQEIGLDFGSSEDKINKFQERIKEAKSIEIDDRFYKSSVTAVPDIGLAKAYVKCIEVNQKFGFFVENIIETPKNVIFNVKYRKRLSSDPMPKVKSFKVIGSTKVLQGLEENQEIPDQFSVSCERYPENELVLSINTDRENLVYLIEKSDVGFAKEFPVGSVITSVLDWNSFSQITEEKSSSEWDAGKSKWAPADGRSVAASKYTRKSGKSNLPDLRGVFVRGLNQFDPFYTQQVSEEQKDKDGINRTAGSFQSDQVKSHQHTFQYTTSRNEASNGGGHGHRVSDSNITRNGITANVGGVETRPKNVAVYYYIRIN